MRIEDSCPCGSAFLFESEGMTGGARKHYERWQALHGPCVDAHALKVKAEARHTLLSAGGPVQLKDDETIEVLDEKQPHDAVKQNAEDYGHQMGQWCSTCRHWTGDVADSSAVCLRSERRDVYSLDGAFRHDGGQLIATDRMFCELYVGDEHA